MDRRTSWPAWDAGQDGRRPGSSPVNALTFVPARDGGTVLVTGSADGRLLRRDLTTGRVLGEPLAHHAGSVNAVAAGVLPDGTPVAVSGSRDRTVRVWDVETGRPRTPPLRGHSDAVTSVAVLDADAAAGVPGLVTGAEDGAVLIRNLLTGRAAAKPLRGHADRVTAVSAVRLPDGGRVAVSGSRDGDVRFWEFGPVRRVSARRVVHDGAITGTEVLPGASPLVLSSSLDGWIRAWDPRTANPVDYPVIRQPEPVTALRLVTLRDGTAVAATGAPDRRVRLWDVHTRRPWCDDVLVPAAIRALAVRPSRAGLQLAVAHDASVVLLDLER